MPPLTIGAILSLVEAVIQEEPAIAAALKAIFSKPAATPSDWAMLRAQVTAKSYEDYVPDTGLPAVAADPAISLLPENPT